MLNSTLLHSQVRPGLKGTRKCPGRHFNTFKSRKLDRFKHRLQESAELEALACSSARNSKVLGWALVLALSKASTLQGSVVSKTAHCGIRRKRPFPKQPESIFSKMDQTFFFFLTCFVSHEIGKVGLQRSSETTKRCLTPAPGKCPHWDHTSGIVNPHGRKDKPSDPPGS